MILDEPWSSFLEHWNSNIGGLKDLLPRSQDSLGSGSQLIPALRLPSSNHIEANPDLMVNLSQPKLYDLSGIVQNLKAYMLKIC